MISSEVQRTLVKSPPELWAELGDPASLARHLGELGEIRITRIDPEQAVEWETEDTTGKVLIKPSAWGTKVTLTATRQTPPAEPEPEPEPAATVAPEPTPEHEIVPAMEAQPEPATQDEAAVEAQPEPELQPYAEPELDPEAELVPRRGFFARLFGRRPKEVVRPEPEPAEQYAAVWNPEPEPAEAVQAVASPEPEQYAPVAVPEPEPVRLDELLVPVEAQPAAKQAAVAEEIAQPVEAHAPAPVPEDTAPPVEGVSSSPQETSAESHETDEEAAGEVTAVLTAVLDRLGSAHHRPFSRG